jgi:glutamine amidotransferase
MTLIIDYGVGNLFSLCASVRSLGEDVVVSGSADEIRKADRIILPGVGAFEDAYKKLEETGLIPVIREQVENKKPLLGICLGMQLLFEESHEFGIHKGLGFIKGSVISLKDNESFDKDDLKVPHMGWNELKIVKNSPLFKYVKNGEYVYYVHSYYAANCDESTVAVSDYSIDVTGAVQNGCVFGTQFHPEKSSDTGLAILKAFVELTNADF